MLSTEMIQGLFFIFIRVVLEVCIIWKSIQLIRSGASSMPAMFFTFAIISFMMSDLYWITYVAIRSDMQMPFAVNEIGEWALFLLLASALNAAFRKRQADALREMILAALFACASTALWIGWSGEWLQDIITGIVLGYLFCMTVYSLRASDALSPAQWKLMGTGAGGLIVMQTLTFVLPSPAKQALDTCCYVLMYAGHAAFYAKALQTWRKGADARQLCSLCFAGFAWGISSMYMSAFPMYYISEMAATGFILPMGLSVRKMVEEDDLC